MPADVGGAAPSSQEASIGGEIMSILKRRAASEYDGYIHPQFLTEITDLLEEYFHLEETEVDDWVRSMWSQ